MIKLAKGRGSGVAWAALIIAIIALGLSGYFLYTTTLKPSPKASVYVSTSYSITTTTWTEVNFDKAVYDSHGAFNFATDEYIVPESGYYIVTGTVTGYYFYDLDRISAAVYVNTTKLKFWGNDQSSGGFGQISAQATGILWLEAGWTVSLKFSHTGSIGSKIIQGGEGVTHFVIYKVE